MPLKILAVIILFAVPAIAIVLVHQTEGPRHSMAADSGKPVAASDDAALRETVGKMVRDEMQRQLPEAVEKEIRNHLPELRKWAREENARQMEAAGIDPRINATRSTLQTIRSQIELYKIQHADQCPAILSSWNQLLQHTDQDGRTAGNATFGPYMMSAPVNPLNGSAKVVAIGDATSDAGWVFAVKGNSFDFRFVLPREVADQVKKRVDAGDFEIPTAEHDAARARYAEPANSLLSTLQTVRCQLELYKIQHNDRAATVSQMINWQALLGHSEASGEVHPKGKFGPYLQAPPENPFNHQSSIAPTGKATATTGWTYRVVNDLYELRAVVPDEATKKAACLDDGDVELPAK